MKDYDVIVVGAGLGGLSAATWLSKEGKSVLLLERHSVPGGYASSFKRGRFEFEISLHELSGLGSEQDRGPLYKLFESCGISERVEFIRIPEFYRSVFPDVDITIPLGRENFEAELCSHFPAEREGLMRFSDTMFEFAEQALKANRVGMSKVAKDPDSFPVLMRHFGASLSDVLNPMVADEKARAVLGQIWGYYCLPPSQLSFLIYALGTVSYLRFGPAHIKGTSQALSQAFVDIIEANGSDVRLNCGVSRVMAAGGKVFGVITDAGESIDCPVVVCNVNPLTTCLDLIGVNEVPDWYLKRLGAGTGGASTFNVYLGLDCPYQELGLENHETFVNTGYDLDGHYQLMKAGIEVEPAEAAVTAYNAVDPDFSPPGTSVVVITLIARADPWLALDPEQYAVTKTRVADRVIALAERIAPDIRKHIEVVEVATPLTNARYRQRSRQHHRVQRHVQGNGPGAHAGTRPARRAVLLERLGEHRRRLRAVHLLRLHDLPRGAQGHGVRPRDASDGQDQGAAHRAGRGRRRGGSPDGDAYERQALEAPPAAREPQGRPDHRGDGEREDAAHGRLRGRAAAFPGGAVRQPVRRYRRGRHVAAVQHLVGPRQALLRPDGAARAGRVRVELPP
jgi:phytoene dehydrogenase-like protein